MGREPNRRKFMKTFGRFGCDAARRLANTATHQGALSSVCVSVPRRC